MGFLARKSTKVLNVKIVVARSNSIIRDKSFHNDRTRRILLNSKLLSLEIRRLKNNSIYYSVSISNVFKEKFKIDRKYYYISSNDNDFFYEIKIPIEYFRNFCRGDLKDSIYISKNILYINVLDQYASSYWKTDYRNMSDTITVSQRILNKLCRVQIKMLIPSYFFSPSLIIEREYPCNKSVIEVDKPIFHKKTKAQSLDIGVTAITLNDNRKCTLKNHNIQDIQAKLRISSKPSGEIVTCTIPAAYCETCNMYIILKNDFKKVKEQGIILCPVIDRTKNKVGNKNFRYQTGTESITPSTIS